MYNIVEPQRENSNIKDRIFVEAAAEAFVFAASTCVPDGSTMAVGGVVGDICGGGEGAGVIGGGGLGSEGGNVGDSGGVEDGSGVPSPVASGVGSGVSDPSGVGSGVGSGVSVPSGVGSGVGSGVSSPAGAAGVFPSKKAIRSDIASPNWSSY